MHPAIQVRSEGLRGCGWRKPGGLYLVSNGETIDCGRLPIPCGTCPCCGRGMRPARGWTWVKADEIIRAAPDCKRKASQCRTCIIEQVIRERIDIGWAGLIWVGEAHYPTVGDFTREIEAMGISRRLNHIPKDFDLGETYVMLAHRRAILASGPAAMGKPPVYEPGIFMVFKPQAIEVVCDGTESDAKIEDYVKRGLTPVIIERLGPDQERMPLDEV